MQLPHNFKLIRRLDNLIEFKSQFHFWYLLENPFCPETYIVFHKHHFKEDYHRQYVHPLSFSDAIAKIKEHDAYVESVRFKR